MILEQTNLLWFYPIILHIYLQLTQNNIDMQSVSKQITWYHWSYDRHNCWDVAALLGQLVWLCPICGDLTCMVVFALTVYIHRVSWLKGACSSNQIWTILRDNIYNFSCWSACLFNQYRQPPLQRLTERLSYNPKYINLRHFFSRFLGPFDGHGVKLISDCFKCCKSKVDD